MSQSLAPCPSCSRHVKTSEGTCPFCKSALAAGSLIAIPGATHRLGRAAAFAFTASLAVAGCTAGVSGPSGDDGGTQGDGGTNPDGATDASARDSAPKPDGTTPPPDDGGVQPPYGAPLYGAPGFDP